MFNKALPQDVEILDTFQFDHADVPDMTGQEKAAILMQQPVWNRALLDELSQAMRDASICGLGQAASNPLTTVIKYFPDEFKDAAE